MSQAVALAKNIRISPRKAGLVASLIRGREVEDALVILDHTPKKAARILHKVVSSAQANATNNHNLLSDGLIISELSIGPGEDMKRFRPVAFGRAHPYKHRTSNIRVVVTGQQKPQPKPKATKAKADKTKATKTAKAKETA